MSTPPDPLAEIRASFFVECEELLEALQDGLQALQNDLRDKETINSVFRAVHSIKGGAAAFGLEALVQFSHRFENTLDALREGALVLDDAGLNVLFCATDHLADVVAASRNGSAVPQGVGQKITDALDGLLGASTGLDAPDQSPPSSVIATTTRQFDISFKPNADLFESGSEPALLFECLAELGVLDVTCDVSDVPPLSDLTPETPMLRWQMTLQTAVDLAEVSSIFEFVEGLCDLDISAPDASQDAPPQRPASLDHDLNTGAPVKPADSGETATATASTHLTPKAMVRVDLERVERLVNLVGELVINQAMLSQSLETSGLSPHSDTMSGLEEFQRLTRDIQDSVMMIRAQPVKSLFQRMARIVREASGSVGKDVRLVTVGEDTEVDKTVIERLADPLTHMIRNAVDHGIEDPATRAEHGKSPQGQVRLSAVHRSGRVIIEVSDDGGGIDRARVLQLAQSKGLVATDANLSDTEIDNLLFLPGFSTASEVSDLSGRGVGMDVVRAAIQSLGGRVTLTSEPQSGTRLTISLPLTLAVLDGMVVCVADQTLVLPLNQVLETLTLEPDDIQMVRPGHPVLDLRGSFVPVIDLAQELGYRADQSGVSGAAALLIRDEDGRRAALIVDDILDQRQVVIKGLNDTFCRAAGVAAATILGDGQIALILEPSDIMKQALSRPSAPPVVAPVASEGLRL